MARYVIQVASMAEAVRLQKKKEREVREAIREAQIESAHATRRRVVQTVDKLGLVDTGLYKASWEVREQGEEVLLENNAPYAGVIEQGSRPFTPPLAPLVAWAERKAGDLGFANSKKFKGRASLTSEQRAIAFQIARAIQQKFKREGYRARYVMKGAIPFAEAAFKRALEERLDKIARDPN